MRPASPPTRAPDDGYILVAVLSVMLLLTGIIASSSVYMRSALHAARLGTEEDAMTGLGQGALEITAYELFVLKLPPRLVDGRRIRLAGATLTPTIVDEAGKVDINGADPKMLQAIFESVGMDSGAAASLVVRIIARRGDQKTPGAPAPAATPPGTTSFPPQSQTQVQTQTPAAPAPAPGATGPDGQAQKKLRGFQSVEEIGDFPEVTAADLRALTPLLTVYNPDGKINILTASADVLAAIPGLTKPRIEDILAHRDSATDKIALDNLESALGEAKTMAKHDPGPAFSVTLNISTTRNHTIHAVMAASKSPTDPYYVLDWRE